MRNYTDTHPVNRTSGYKYDVQTIDEDEKYIETPPPLMAATYKGFFRPPSDGWFKILCNADDIAKVWISHGHDNRSANVKDLVCCCFSLQS